MSRGRSCYCGPESAFMGRDWILSLSRWTMGALEMTQLTTP